jgi:hypothetical protein
MPIKDLAHINMENKELENRLVIKLTCILLNSIVNDDLSVNHILPTTFFLYIRMKWSALFGL